MNFNVYIDERTAVCLEKMAKATRKSRNALVRQALEKLLERNPKPAWPQAVLDFAGLAEVPRFESFRRDLLPVGEDPLS